MCERLRKRSQSEPSPEPAFPQPFLTLRAKIRIPCIRCCGRIGSFQWQSAHLRQRPARQQRHAARLFLVHAPAPSPSMVPSPFNSGHHKTAPSLEPDGRVGACALARTGVAVPRHPLLRLGRTTRRVAGGGVAAGASLAVAPVLWPASSAGLARRRRALGPRSGPAAACGGPA